MSKSVRNAHIVLGISGVGGHDSAAALVVEGAIVAAAEEERFNREKNTGAFPAYAIEYCLAEAGIGMADVEAVIYAFDPSRRWFQSLKYNLRTAAGRAAAAIERGGPEAIKRAFSEAMSIESRISEAYQSTVAWFAERLPSVEVEVCGHHEAHAACGWLLSGLESATVVVVDLIGEWDTTVVFYAHEGALERVNGISYPDSIGQLYAVFTRFLGFRPLSDEYKVMGLAAYGSDASYPFFENLVTLKEGGCFVLNREHLPFTRGIYPGWSTAVGETLGPPRLSAEPILKRHADIAAGLQHVTEILLRHIVHAAVVRTGVPDVVLSGGVGLNCVANQAIAEMDVVRSLYVPPAPHDAGCALGAALLGAGSQPQQLQTAYLGPNYDDPGIIAAAIRQASIVPSYCDVSGVAEALADGRIIGLFRGRMEFGPRALGNRSILASPVSSDMRDRINSCVKYREPFRPFAPVVRVEDAPSYFEGAIESPFMARTFTALEMTRRHAPAIVHNNGRARVQTVDREQNRFLHDLLGHFGERTGVPILLNTSLNVRGSPIARTPEEAIKTFLDSGLDGLLLGDGWLITKRAASGAR